jgi:hypothetical protein
VDIVSFGSTCCGMPDVVGYEERHTKQVHVLDYGNRCNFGCGGEGKASDDPKKCGEEGGFGEVSVE